MTIETRAAIRRLIDTAARAKARADDALELRRMIEDGICRQCDGPIGPARMKRRAAFCAHICMKRSHYAQDVARAAQRARVRRLVL